MDGQKIAVILAVISLIYIIIAKLCADTPPEPSVLIPSMKRVRMRPVRMRIPAARSSVSILIIFRSITAIPMKLTMNTRAQIMMTTIPTGLMITTTMRAITTISEINKIQQEYFTSILLDKVKMTWYNNKAVARER